MSPPAALIDAAYERYAVSVRALHRLFMAGQGESDEADALRDRMDGPWEALTEDQRALVSGLTADLNWIRREPVRADIQPDKIVTEELPKLAEALQASNWPLVLTVLRRAAPCLARTEIAELRGRAWDGLGDHESARLFFEHAGRRSAPAWAQRSHARAQAMPRLEEAHA